MAIQAIFSISRLFGPASAPPVSRIGKIGRVDAIPMFEPGIAKGKDQERAPKEEPESALEPKAPPALDGRSAALFAREGSGPFADRADPLARNEATSFSAAGDASERGREARLDEKLNEARLGKTRAEGEARDIQTKREDGKRKAGEAQAARSMDESKVLASLRSRDTEVRAHEAAHVGAGGRYVRGGASYSYQKGPDGRNYAIGGEVGIDSSPEADPAQTIAKMRIVKAAALAPAEPSGADLAVAGAASQAEAQAMAELARSRADEIAERYAAGTAEPRGGALDLSA